MRKRFKTYKGLLKWSHKKMTVTVTRKVNPPSMNARLATKLEELFPEYTVIKDYE